MIRPLPNLPVHATLIRFASTTTDPPSTLVAEPILNSSTVSTGDSLPDAQNLLDLATAPPAVGRHIGFLNELGLDFGWGPTALVQWVFEHVHVYAGTPWWASIIITLLAIRVAIFKTYIGSADTSARLLVIKPYMQDVRDRLDDAKRAQDMPETMRRMQELKNVYSAAGIKMWKTFLPFVNLPLGYGMFRLTRNMSEMPVPGLEDGGLLWITDLTLSDPTFLLPIGTGISTFFLFKNGGELGTSAAMNPNVMRLFQWGMPIASTIFTSFWPAAMQLSFFWTSVMALTQARMFKQPWFRQFWKIHPLPSKDDSTTQRESRTGYKGMVIPTTAREIPQQADVSQDGAFGSAKAKFQATMTDLQERGQKFVKDSMEKNRKSPTSRRSAAEINEAKKYDEKRRKEIEQARSQNFRRKHARR
ncbi:MAG: hypothetical protein Q9209_002128 [Squamulea sp. 1 TL-2023]